MQQEGQAILVAVFTLVFLCAILIVLFIVFQKHKNKLLLKQNEAEKQFDQEIAKTQIEIREETFRNISWELHDNIGQLLTLAKIQLQNASDNKDVMVTLDKGLKELRILSKAINPEALKNISLATAINQEVERLNRLQYLKASLHIEGEERTIDNEVEVVFFRMLQEFFSNTIKHAKATHLKVFIKFDGNELNILAEDDGTGFNKNNPERSGIGLTNIKKRAELVNAKVTVNSTINEGTQLHISYTLKSQV